MVESTGVLLASGSRVALRYTREGVRNTTPAAVVTPTTGISAVATSASGTGYSNFARASGSFVDDGFVKGQRVRTAGFANADNNGDWLVHSVAALTLVVVDAGDIIDNESAATGQTVRILLSTLRGTGRNVSLEKNILESQEIDPDGQETDSRHGFNRVVGSPGFQLSRADYDDMIEYVMGREWDSGLTVVSTGVNLSLLTNDVDPPTATITRASGTWSALGFRAGDIVITAGFSNGANNRQLRVISVSGVSMTVDNADDVLIDETAGASKTVTLVGKRIDIGNEMMTFLVQREFQDISQFQLFNGVAADQWAMTIEPESMINGTFNLLGMSAAPVAGTSVSGVSALTATSNAPYAAFDGEIFEGGERIAVATSMNFTLERNRSLNPIIGSRFSPDVFAGTARCTGTMMAYFDSVALLNKFINETESTVWVRLDDPNDSAHFLNIVFPRVKYNGGTIDPPQEGPVTIEMPFRALKATGLALPGGLTRNSLLTIQVGNGIA